MKLLFRRIDGFWDSWPLLARMFSFATIGLVNTAIDLTVFTVAYNVFGLPLVACNVLAWLVAVTGSYAMNTLVTFRSESGSKLRRKDYLTFVASGFVGVVAATITLLVCSRFASVAVAKLISILVSFAVNFTMSKLIVFRPRLAK